MTSFASANAKARSSDFINHHALASEPAIGDLIQRIRVTSFSALFKQLEGSVRYSEGLAFLLVSSDPVRALARNAAIRFRLAARA